MQLVHGAVVAVVDGRKSIFYRNQGDATRPVLDVLAHEEHVHPNARAFGTDRPGRTHSGPSQARSAYSETDFHEEAEVDFAKAAAARLNDMALHQDIPAFIVVAPPRTLGVLRPQWHKVLRAKLQAELSHEATQLTAGELVEMLEAKAHTRPLTP